jgi:hypothetical protein
MGDDDDLPIGKLTEVITNEQVPFPYLLLILRTLYQMKAQIKEIVYAVTKMTRQKFGSNVMVAKVGTILSVLEFLRK